MIRIGTKACLALACTLALLCPGLAPASTAEVSEVTFMEDPSRNLTIEQAISKEREGKFFSTAQGVFQTKPSSSAFWARMTAKSHARAFQEYILYVPMSRLDYIDVWVFEGSRLVRHIHEGDIYPFHQREIKHRNAAFSIPLEPGIETEIYFRTAYEQDRPLSLHLSLKLMSYQKFAERTSLEEIMFGLLYGSAAVMLFFNLLMWFATRQKSYLYYVAYILCFWVYWTLYNGHAYQYIFPGSPFLQQSIWPLWFGGTALFGALFARAFLHSWETAPVLDKFLVFMVWYSLLIPLLIFFSFTLSFYVALGVGLFVPFFVMVGVNAWWNGFQAARYFVAGWTFLAFGSVCQSLWELGYMPDNQIFSFSAQFGWSMELVLLSVALADRMRLFMIEKEAAQKHLKDVLEKAKEELETKVTERTNELNIVIETAPVGIMFVNNFLIKKINHTFLELFRCSPGQFIGKTTSSLYPPDQAPGEINKEKIKEHFLEGKTFQREAVFRRADGSTFWGRLLANPARPGEWGAGTGAIVTIEDLSEKRIAEQKLLDSEKNLSKAQQIAKVGNWTWDLDSGEFTWSKEMYRIFGLKPGEIKPGKQVYHSFFTPAEAQKLDSIISEAVQHMDIFQYEGSITAKNGEMKHVYIQGEIVCNPFDKTSVLVGTIQDITQRKKTEEKLRMLATTDELTGVNNRRNFMALAEKEFARTKRYGHPTAALMLDIDHFKKINDGFGHAAGDRVLKTFAALLKESVRDIDITGRLGGEEFACILPETGIDEAELAAERFSDSLSKAGMEIAKAPLVVTFSAGISMIEPQDESIEQAIHRADTALYAAKESGRNRVLRYDLLPVKD